jgi:hypothetical protein
MDKETVGTNGDEIHEELRLIWVISGFSRCGMTAGTTQRGRTVRRQMLWTHLVKWLPFLLATSNFDVFGLVGFV